MQPIHVCLVGTGQFAQCFVPLYLAHPAVGKVSLCDHHPGRLEAEARRFKINSLYREYEEVLRDKSVTAVALFTSRWSHAPMAVQALQAGKHVYSAVPAATSLEELHHLVESVRSTGLVYMMGETSQYYGARLFMKEKWEEGAFGRFVHGEAAYYHDMSHGFYEAFRFAGGEDWKSGASFPPMLYPTHSVAMILSVTGARVTDVSCLGWEDHHEDGIFREDVSRWGNTFSNQSALMRTSDGGSLRINEFRRVGISGGRSVRGSLYATEAAFEDTCGGAFWTTRESHRADSVEDLIQCGGVHSHEQWQKIQVDVALKGDFASGFAPIHQKYRQRLPDSYRSQPNGHEGSHQFLTDDFVSSIVHCTLPSVSVWDAARYNAPGIVAHESSRQGGKRLTVPDFGNPPT